MTLAMFRSGAPAGESTVEGFTTDADRFALETAPGGAPRKLFLRGSRFEGGGVDLRTSRPASLSVSWADGRTEVEIEGEAEGATLVLRLLTKPGMIELNGSPVRGWAYDRAARELRLRLPAGHSLIKIT